MRRWVLRVSLCCVLLAIVSCRQWDLPSNEQVEGVFAPAQPTAMLKQPQPHNVPAFDTTRTEDWHTLCSQCHRGPNFSSHTILNWGHRAGCLANTSCVECHGQKLHRMDVRGQKRVCFDCHLVRQLPHDCNTCHVKGWKEQHQPHGVEYVSLHGPVAKTDAQQCMKCHGSENWCTACHGLPMPHPAGTLKEHPGFVQGKPERCAKCHGAKPCETCHLARGVMQH